MSARARAGGALVAAAVLAGAFAPAAAQTRPEPQLLLSVFGGATSGLTLYDDLRQPLVLIEDPSLADTLLLGRRFSSALAIGASATYFPRPSLALTGEIAFLGFGLDDSCSMRYTAPAVVARPAYNEQVCSDIGRRGGPASTFAFYVGGMYRIMTRGAVRPYLRAHGGITARSATTVAVSGRYVDATGLQRARLVIDDQDPGALNPSASFGLGFMLPFAAGYQARLEFRDHLLLVTRAAGPASSLAQAPTEQFLAHSYGLVLTLDVVLEQRRGRRY